MNPFDSINNLNHLLQLVSAGDKAAEERIFQFLLFRFRVFAKRRLKEDIAEDLSQDACLTVLEKIRNGFVPVEFAAWSYGVLKNKIGNYYQHRQVRQNAAGRRIETNPKTNQYKQEAEGETRRRLIECMRELIKGFPLHARVINLVYQGYKTDEISARLNIKQGYVYVILSAGRKLLRQCLGNKGL